MVPNFKLNSGYDFPAVGFGTYGGPSAHDEVYRATKVALDVGYRHIDTAYLYRTEDAVGQAVRESNVPRDQLFITTKLWNSFHKPEHVRPAFDLSLKQLQMDYVDLYLIHWPLSFEFKGYGFDDLIPFDANRQITPIEVPIIDTWREMEKLVKAGLARSIGVSNFSIPQLEALLKECEIPPAVNQVEIHPNLPQEELVAWCKEHNIVLTAYSPLANPGKLGRKLSMYEQPAVLNAAEKHKKTPAQILLSWAVSRGYAAIPKSVTPSRIKDNLELVTLEPEEIEAITKIGRSEPIRTCDPAVMWGKECTLF